MKRLFIFNPEHDLALANGNRHFIAPRNIREMAHDLAPLIEYIDSNHPLVWGWDAAIKERLHRSGYPEGELPTDTAIAALRLRSERQTAHKILHAYNADHPNGIYEGESKIIRAVDDIEPYAESHQHILLKDPLSGSGKGLRHVSVNTDWSKTREWAQALIGRHGYLTAEPYYDKVKDFAMEFYAKGAECQFIGYSLFTTNHHGRYEGNILTTDEKIEETLVQYIPRTALRELQAWIVRHKGDIIPTEWDTTQFPLYFGIDMMVVKATANTETTCNTQFKLHPCVEINLRLNMGIVAHAVHHSLLATGSEGTFHVVSFPTREALWDFHCEQQEKYPKINEGGRIVAGYHPLTPIHPHTLHYAYILCRRAE